MKIGTGIAVAGIWIGVGLAAFGARDMIAAVAACGMFATLFVAIVS